MRKKNWDNSQYFGTDKYLKGTVVYRTCAFLNVESLEFISTVYLKITRTLNYNELHTAQY